VPIGLTKPLPGLDAWLIGYSAAFFTLVVIGSLVGALSNLNSGRVGATVAAGLAAIAFSALAARLLYDFLPQRAWLDGSVLIVERGGRQRECDLATAKMIKLSSTMPPLDRGYPHAVPVLLARQDHGHGQVRLVLRGDDLRIVSADQLLLLAEAIQSGPSPAPHAPKVCRRLRKLADKQQPLPTLDWSFRTDPHGTRRTTK
jgi:hypothetical protein